MCFNYLFEKKYGITKPVDTEIIDKEELRTLLFSEFKTAKNPYYPDIWLGDKQYKVAPKSEIERFLDWSDVDKRLYRINWYDCENFAWALMGDMNIPYWSDLAMGVVWVSRENKDSGHAINWCVDKERNVWLIEPQNDNLFVLPDDYWPYLILK